MKTVEIIAGFAPCSTGRRGQLLRRYGHPRPDALLPLHHDALAGLQALFDHSKARAVFPELHSALLDFIVSASFYRPWKVRAQEANQERQTLMALLKALRSNIARIE